MCLKGNTVVDENISRQKTVKKIPFGIFPPVSVTARLFGSEVERGRLRGRKLTPRKTGIFDIESWWRRIDVETLCLEEFH